MPEEYGGRGATAMLFNVKKLQGLEGGVSGRVLVMQEPAAVASQSRFLCLTSPLNNYY